MRFKQSASLISGVATLAVALLVMLPGTAKAEGLQIRPLMFREKLQTGEVKKGFVDVSNASHTPVTVILHAKSFRQSDNQGNLRFMDSDALTKGIRLDLTEVDLGPREAIRVYFSIDGKKLPAGDVFAAIFAATKVQANSGIVPSTQVGTLLVIENGMAGPRKAEVKNLNTALIHTGGTLRGTVDVHNPAPRGQATAFFPRMSVTIGPLQKESRKFEGPLVFADKTRTVDFSMPAGNRLGIYRVAVETGESTVGKWIILVTGFWRWVLAALVVIVLVSYVVIKKSGRKKNWPVYKKRRYKR